MKVTMMVLFLALSSAAASAPRQATRATIYGVITDSYCARDGHAEAMRLSRDMGTTDASCTVACVHKGANLVLVERGSGKTYVISDPLQAIKYAGQTVKIVGTVMKNKIVPSSIEAAGNAESSAPRR